MNPRPPLVMWVVEVRQDRHDTPYSQGFENGLTIHAAEGILLGFGESDESLCDNMLTYPFGKIPFGKAIQVVPLLIAAQAINAVGFFWERGRGKRSMTSSQYSAT